MTQYLTIHVKKGHILNGTAGSTEYCPIALAVMDQHPRLKKVRVTNYGIDCSDNDRVYCFKHSEKSRMFIRKVDNDKRVKPATFRLRKESD